MIKETKSRIVPVGVLRMAGFPAGLLDQFRLGKTDYDSFREKTQLLRQKLYELFSNNEMVREAIWTSSDSVFHSLNKLDYKANRNSEARSFEKLLTKFLFRFCYKNDTTSFFGPSCYIPLNSLQSKSIEGIVDDEIANREKTDTNPASWVKDIPRELLQKYNVAKGVEEKSKILEMIVNKIKDKNPKTHWKWYNERTPVYELCPANVHLTIGGELLKDITHKMGKLNERFGVFYSLMYNVAVQNGFYSKLFNEVQKRIKSNRMEDWFKFFYSADLSDFNHIHAEMVEFGKELFERVFFENLRADKAKKVLSPFFSPDILICSPSMEDINQGNYEFLVGDVHGSLTCYQKPPSIYLDERLVIESIDLLNRYVFDRIKFYFPKGFIPDTFDLPTRFNVKRDIGDVSLHLENGEICLNEPDSYVEFFYNDVLAKVIPLGAFHLEQFFPDIQEGICVEGTRIKRRSFTIESDKYFNEVHQSSDDPYKNWHALFEKTREFFKKINFDGVVFVMPDCEYKPFAVDIDNPFCCEILEHYAKKSKIMRFYEMLPKRNDLWLKNSNGDYTSELRLSFYGETK